MLFPGMDGILTFLGKTGRWAGSTHSQIKPTSRVKLQRLLHHTGRRLPGSADSNPTQHKAATVLT
jgi:hypothetical protein